MRCNPHKSRANSRKSFKVGLVCGRFFTRINDAAHHNSFEYELFEKFIIYTRRVILIPELLPEYYMKPGVTLFQRRMRIYHTALN